MEIVERMLRMRKVKSGDYVIDLGSGDGRIVIEAAKPRSARLGVDYDRAGGGGERQCKEGGVANRAHFEPGHLRHRPVAASVITMYLLPTSNVKLLPRLLRLKPGTRIVSHDGGIGDCRPTSGSRCARRKKNGRHRRLSRVELWIVPAAHTGVWSSISRAWRPWRFTIVQKFQVLDVNAAGARARPAGAREPPGAARKSSWCHRRRERPRLASPVHRHAARQPHRRPGDRVGRQRLESPSMASDASQ